MDSTVGLGIQCVGMFLVALLSFFMLRSARSVPAKYWTIAWSCLTAALASLFVGFHELGEPQRIFYSIYFLGEYSFGLMFIAACRNHTRGERISRRSASIYIPFVLIALALPYLSEDFNNLFIIQAAMLTMLFAVAWFSLRSARSHGASPGVHVMRAALLLLSLDFLQYVAIFGSPGITAILHVPPAYFKYTSIADLILEILLGFGTIMVMMEGVRRELEDMNRELTETRDRLEQMARIDPMTEALNRHAFDLLFSNVASNNVKVKPGCLAVIDLDNLKPINDNYGHAAGDVAICAVAQAVRATTRADDMLFRWGGDEFLVLMFGMHESLGRQRLYALNSLLAETRLPGVAEPVPVGVSYGLASFNHTSDIAQAIDTADEAMYRQKQSNRRMHAGAKA